MMVATQRPGVFTDYDASSVLSGTLAGQAVGLAARSVSGTAGEAQVITRESQAVEQFGADTQQTNMTALIRVLLQNGAPRVVAVAVGGEGQTKDYQSALEVLEKTPGIGAVVAGSTDKQVLHALLQSVQRASGDRMERLAFGAVDGSTAQAVAMAEELNSERFVLAGQTAVVDGKESPCFLAAALAALAVSSSDPAAPLHSTALQGVQQVKPALTENEIDQLVLGGVTPFENTAGRAEVIRTVTTRTTTGGEADSTFRELSTILTIDRVLTSLRGTLKGRMKGAKNNQTTRMAIATQTQVELEAHRLSGLIDAYETPVVTPSESDPGVCLVEVTFAVACGLNQIRITAHVSV